MKGKTRRVILDAALLLFNRDGVESVSTRDIAGAVKISPGNLTYHFPAKNDIISALCDDLILDIDKEIVAAETSKGDVLTRYYRLMERVFHVQLRYRFIFNKRYAEIVTSIPEVQSYYQKILKQRIVFWEELHARFVKEKLAIPALMEESTSLSYTLNILALFWHQEFSIYAPNLTDTKKITQALAIFFQPYKSYLTKKGKEIYNGLVSALTSY